MIKSYVENHVDLIVWSMRKKPCKLVKYSNRHAMGNTKQKAKFVILYTNFKVHGNYQILCKVHDFKDQFP